MAAMARRALEGEAGRVRRPRVPAPRSSGGRVAWESDETADGWRNGGGGGGRGAAPSFGFVRD